MNYQSNYPLQQYNTFHINEFAEEFCSIATEAEAIEVIQYAKDNSVSLHFIGGGSNILLTKKLEGIACLNKLKGISKIDETEDYVILKFQSGEDWHECVQWCVRENFGGIENLSLIPGTIGASPIQNIGAYGVELKDVFESCEVIHLKTLEKKTFHLDECRFGYRDSIFKQEEKGNYFISSVNLRLTKKHHLKLDYGTIKEELKTMNIIDPTIQDVSNAVIRIRQSKLPNPNEIGNAGSFFKNPIIDKAHFESIKEKHPNIPFFPVGNQIKIPAAWLIESQGWKGFRDGAFGVHDKQALVLVNHGNAIGHDLYNLSTKIITSVQLAFNITLEREVNVW